MKDIIGAICLGIAITIPLLAVLETWSKVSKILDILEEKEEEKNDSRTSDTKL